jgi:ubiquinone/menaquinone biosynthesis C-methylase UbiE
MSGNPDTSPDVGNYEGYVFDAENAAEMARLMVQDQVITQAMGGPLPEQTDLSGIFHALDIACGPGGWLFDVAARYPHIQAVGIDKSQLMIEYASHLAASQQFSNLRFQVMDATRPLAFPDHTFDLVNARLLVGVLLKEQWPTLLAECFRILKPGGILRLTEAEWGFTTGPIYDTCTRLAFLGGYRSGHSFSPHGRTCGITPVLRPLMQQAGYQVLGQRAHAVDYSAGTAAHQSNMQNLLVSYKLLQPFLLQMQVATQEELDQLHAQLEGELLADDFCAIDYYLTVWGRKPASDR